MNDNVLKTDKSIGVDGCPGGWVAAIYSPGQANLEFKVVSRLSELIDCYSATAIGIDIPIGLSECEPRACDLAARKFLGQPRGSSVFPEPCRGILRLNKDYRETSEQSRRISGKGISQQTYHILPQIEDVDDVMTPALEGVLFEVHPELSFWKMAGGQPMGHRKKRTAGFNQRRDLLRVSVPGAYIPESMPEARRLAPTAGADDVLDAIVSAWSALRFTNGLSETIPAEPQRDERGLRMRIVF